MRELGATIDLHGGGSDLIFPHHECETAQSEAATGSQFVRHWMHVGMVRLGGEKMSKSLGNLVFVDDLLKEGTIRPRSASRCSPSHYRIAWEWNDTMLDEAEERLERWRSAGGGDGGARRGARPARRRPRHARRDRDHRRGGRCRPGERRTAAALLGVAL